MKRLTVLLALFILAVPSFAQTRSAVKQDLSAPEIEAIVKKFTTNEAQFREALGGYVFNRKARVEIIGLGGFVAGAYQRDSHMMINPDGTRFERILYFPVATTPPGFVSPQDLEDLGGVNPFALDPRAVPQYNFTYVGVETIDDFDLYVFDVAPKVAPKPVKNAVRMFQGRIWVDTKDLMIVKTKGKGIPEYKDNKFPVVETTRDQIDGKYWFPVDARSDDELVFDNGSVIKIRMRIKFSNYSVGRTDVRILDDDEEVVPAASPSPSPTPKKP